MIGAGRHGPDGSMNENVVENVVEMTRPDKNAKATSCPGNFEGKTGTQGV
jgi:hypothetical protein